MPVCVFFPFLRSLRRTSIIHDPTTSSRTVRGHYWAHGARHRPHAFHSRTIFDQTLQCDALSWLIACADLAITCKNDKASAVSACVRARILPTCTGKLNCRSLLSEQASKATTGQTLLLIHVIKRSKKKVTDKCIELRFVSSLFLKCIKMIENDTDWLNSYLCAYSIL